MQIRFIADRAMEKAAIAEGWHLAVWEDFTHKGLAAQKFEFCRCPVITRGKRKGRPNFRKSEERKEVWLTDAELKELTASWIQRTGKCPECIGTGKVMRRWNHVTGTEYMDCPNCTGTGDYCPPKSAVQPERTVCE